MPLSAACSHRPLCGLRYSSARVLFCLRVRFSCRCPGRCARPFVHFLPLSGFPLSRPLCAAVLLQLAFVKRDLVGLAVVRLAVVRGFVCSLSCPWRAFPHWWGRCVHQPPPLSGAFLRLKFDQFHTSPFHTRSILLSNTHGSFLLKFTACNVPRKHSVVVRLSSCKATLRVT